MQSLMEHVGSSHSRCPVPSAKVHATAAVIVPCKNKCMVFFSYAHSSSQTMTGRLITFINKLQRTIAEQILVYFNTSMLVWTISKPHTPLPAISSHTDYSCSIFDLMVTPSWRPSYGHLLNYGISRVFSNTCATSQITDTKTY